MKGLSVSLLVTMHLLISSLVLPTQALAGRQWAVGQWRLAQHYSEYGRETTFSGSLRIYRDGDWFHGSIFFDVLGTWEPLEDIQVTSDSIRFTRPVHGPQYFDGHRRGNAIRGTYWDRERHGEWRWEAWPD